MAKNKSARILTSILLMLTVLTATSSVALAFSDKGAAMGEIVVSGNSDGSGSFVILNGQKAYNGRTFISSGTIKTDDTGATVRLKNLGSINLAPNTTLKIDISENSISGTLSGGRIKVLNNKGVKVDIETSDSKVSNDGNTKNIFEVDLSAGKTNAIADIGSLTVKNGANSAVLAPRQDDDDDDNNILPLVLIFAGIVGVAAWVALRNGDGDEITNVSGTG